jgi:C-terminal domain of 1-Cys peroxiredoxin
VRNVYVIRPDKTIKLLPVYRMTIGRNFNEVVRVIDALHLTARHEVVTPANWKAGDDVMIPGISLGRECQAAIPERLEGAEALYAHRPIAFMRRYRVLNCARHAGWKLPKCFQVVRRQKRD